MTLSCGILAWGFSNVLGYGRVRDGEAGEGEGVKLDTRGEPLPDGSQDELSSTGDGNGNGKGKDGKRDKKSSGGSYIRTFTWR